MRLYFAVVLGSWIVTRLPLRAAYGVGAIAGTVAYRVSSRARWAIQSNLSVVLDLPEGHALVRLTAERAFRNNAKNWIDSLRLGRTTRAEILSRVGVEGWDLLESALKAGDGVVMIGAHLGNIDVVGQIIAAHGLPLTIPVEPVRPEALFRRTQQLRQSLGIRAIPAAQSARRLLRALREGGVVGIMADRNLADDGVEVEFFGRPTTVSRGPAWLATHCRAPVLCGTGTRRSDGTFAGLVSAVEISRTGDSQYDIQVNAASIMRELERRIRQNPDQWCMFVPVWNAVQIRGT